ncbi:MAG: sulfite exporter TauE/SafE family protein [Methylotetracoccus sp.]
MSIVNTRLNVSGMQCAGCEEIIERALGKLQGIRRVAADYSRERVEVSYDDRLVAEPRIAEVIREQGYDCVTAPPSRRPLRWRSLLWVLLGLAGLALIVLGARWADRVHLPQFDQNLSYGLLFGVGLLTGFHCVGMCGGFVLGYATSNAGRGCASTLLCHARYGIGKTLSYTLVGALFGFLGSVIAFTPELRGIAGIVAGTFLVLMGLSMLRLIRGLRLGVRMPVFLQRLVRGGAARYRGPFVIGLLNGLMIACGPLQAMYVMAAGTGSAIEGAKRLFVFGVGTLPVLLGFGMMASLVSHTATERILKASGAFVLLIGLIMINRGLVLTGSGYDVRTLTAVAALAIDRRLHQGDAETTESETFQTIRMRVTASGYEPNAFVLRKGVPVHWVIDAIELTSCNRRIEVPMLGLQIDLKPGVQEIEFVPLEPGVIPWSCWMGMLPGTFVVEAPAGPATRTTEGGSTSAVQPGQVAPAWRPVDPLGLSTRRSPAESWPACPSPFPAQLVFPQRCDAPTGRSK